MYLLQSVPKAPGDDKRLSCGKRECRRHAEIPSPGWSRSGAEAESGVRVEKGVASRRDPVQTRGARWDPRKRTLRPNVRKTGASIGSTLLLRPRGSSPSCRPSTMPFTCRRRAGGRASSRDQHCQSPCNTGCVVNGAPGGVRVGFRSRRSWSAPQGSSEQRGYSVCRRFPGTSHVVLCGAGCQPQSLVRIADSLSMTLLILSHFPASCRSGLPGALCPSDCDTITLPPPLMFH
jgi:hypothetical protein